MLLHHLLRHRLLDVATCRVDHALHPELFCFEEGDARVCTDTSGFYISAFEYSTVRLNVRRPDHLVKDPRRVLPERVLCDLHRRCIEHTHIHTHTAWQKRKIVSNASFDVSQDLFVDEMGRPPCPVHYIQPTLSFLSEK